MILLPAKATFVFVGGDCDKVFKASWCKRLAFLLKGDVSGHVSGRHHPT